MVARLKEGCCECPPSGFEHPICNKLFNIQIRWPGGVGADLDTGVLFSTTNSSSGYDCDNAANPKFKSGDLTGGNNLVESHFISVAPDPHGNTQTIEVFLHWHQPASPQPDQDIIIYVIDCADDKEEYCVTKTSVEADGCSCDVGELKAVVTINADLTWTLDCGCSCECNEGTYPCISEDDAFGKSVERFTYDGTNWVSNSIETYDNWITSENGCEGYYDQSSLGTYKVKYMATSGGCEKYFSVSIMMGWDGNEWEPVTKIVNGAYYPSNFNFGTPENPAANDIKYVFS